MYLVMYYKALRRSGVAPIDIEIGFGNQCPCNEAPNPEAFRALANEIAKVSNKSKLPPDIEEMAKKVAKEFNIPI